MNASRRLIIEVFLAICHWDCIPRCIGSVFRSLKSASIVVAINIYDDFPGKWLLPPSTSPPPEEHIPRRSLLRAQLLPWRMDIIHRHLHYSRRRDLPSSVLPVRLPLASRFQIWSTKTHDVVQTASILKVQTHLSPLFTKDVVTMCFLTILWGFFYKISFIWEVKQNTGGIVWVSITQVTMCFFYFISIWSLIVDFLVVGVITQLIVFGSPFASPKSRLSCRHPS